LSNTIVKTVEIVAALGSCASIGYYFLCIASAAKFLTAQRLNSRRAYHEGRASLPISILKPLKGTDPQMLESFRSHCRQDYPEYEIIFGVNDRADSAIPLVQQLQTEFPQRTIRLVLCEQILGNNTKVSNLAQMVKVARHEHLVVNDSDIRVPSNYLQSISAQLSDANTGLVTCLYRGVASGTLGSRLESLGIGTDFVPGVLAAWQLEGGLSFGLGSTLAFRKTDLVAAGGFEAIADYLADDYELGHRIAALGRKVELSPTVVETFLPPYSFAEFLDHQLRWARTIRDSRPGGYFGLLFTFGLPWATLAVVAARGAAWSWIALSIALVARCVMAWMTGNRVLQDAHVVRSMWLLPLRDYLGLLTWFASFTGHSISWRGDSFRLVRGQLIRESR
jgi:ceramide glucosyltransferase